MLGSKPSSLPLPQVRQRCPGDLTAHTTRPTVTILSLEALGFVWNPLEEDFQRALDYLKAYKAEHGDCNVPKRSNLDGFNLGMWCGNQRTGYRVGRLSQERIDALEALGFDL